MTEWKGKYAAATVMDAGDQAIRLYQYTDTPSGLVDFVNHIESLALPHGYEFHSIAAGLMGPAMIIYSRISD